MNEVLKTIYERRSVRKYKDLPVERSVVEQVLNAGRMAPSAINSQPWKFYVLMDKEKIQLLSKEISASIVKEIPKIGIKKLIKSAAGLLHISSGLNFLIQRDPVFHGAPVVIFITAPGDNEWASLDVGMCTQNMMLAAKSIGLDTCPVGFGKYVIHAPSFPILKIPTSEEVKLSLIIGLWRRASGS